jgi:hypothetical protein
MATLHQESDDAAHRCEREINQFRFEGGIRYGNKPALR